MAELTEKGVALRQAMRIDLKLDKGAADLA